MKMKNPQKKSTKPKKVITTKPKKVKTILDHFGDGSSKQKPKGQAITADCAEDNHKPIHNSEVVQWACYSNSTYQACANTIKTLSSGLYLVFTNERGLFFGKQTIETDDLLYFPGSELQAILDDIDHFWGLSQNFKKYGFLHRRGYMLIGPAGCGKTCLVQLIMQSLIKQEGIIIDANNTHPYLVIEAIKLFRLIEPDRNIICLFEDLDAYIDNYNESSLLSLLDGESQTNHVLNIATTNYPEKLDKRIVGRPRRFDRVKYIGYPDNKTREVFFNHKLQINGEELKKYVNSTKEFTFAAMAELVISTKCFEKDFDIAIEEIKELLTHNHSSDNYYNKPVGFDK